MDPSTTQVLKLKQTVEEGWVRRETFLEEKAEKDRNYDYFYKFKLNVSAFPAPPPTHLLHPFLLCPPRQQNQLPSSSSVRRQTTRMKTSVTIHFYLITSEQSPCCAVTKLVNRWQTYSIDKPSTYCKRVFFSLWFSYNLFSLTHCTVWLHNIIHTTYKMC